MGLIDLRGINILGTCLGAFAASVTIWRLIYRWRTNKLWWDDGWAFFAMCCGLVPVGCVWVVFAPPDSSVTQTARVVCFYLLEVAFTWTIWSARLSILWTIIRITPDLDIRKWLLLINVLFMTFATILTAQKFWVCVPQPGWTTTPGSVCDLGKQVAISEIVTDIIGDVILIVVPVKLLWNIRISRALRIRLFVVFSMSILTTTVSLAQNYYLINDGGLRDFIVSHVELQTAVTVCNLNVLIAAVYRLFKRRELEETGQNKQTGIITIGSRRPPPIKSLSGTFNTGIHVQTETIEWDTASKSKDLSNDDISSEYESQMRSKGTLASEYDSPDLENGKQDDYPMVNIERLRP